MKYGLLSRAGRFLKKQTKRRRWTIMFLCMAAAVALGTFGFLKLYGEAMTHKVRILECGYEVHEHGPECYEEDEEGNQVLVCGMADYVIHTHNDDCYDRNGELVCPLKEHELHEHDESCYKEEKVLVCGMEEDEGSMTETAADAAKTTDAAAEETTTAAKNEETVQETEIVREMTCKEKEHTHDDSCYEEKIGCGLEAHIHDDGCYKTVETLTCEKEEHTHDDSCYSVDENGESVLICDKEEHAHDDSCYETEKVPDCDLEEHEHDDSCIVKGEPICGMEEHEHDDSCYTDTVKVTKSAAPAAETTKAAEITKAAETTKAAEMTKAGTDAKNGAGHTHTDQCYETRKVLICGEHELHTHNTDPESDDCCYSEDCFDKEGKLIEGSRPSCGLLELKEHIHLEECFKTVELTPEEIEALNGGAALHVHTEDCYDEDGKLICGYETTHLHGPECYDEDGHLICGYGSGEGGEYEKTCEGDGYAVKVTYSDSAKIPEDAELIVRQITRESDPERYEQRQAEAKEVLENENTSIHALFDIGFYVDGEEIEPEDTVNVTIQFLDDNGLPEGTAVTIVHFAEDGNEVLGDSDVDSEGNASFQTDSFSEFLLASAGGEIAVTREVTPGEIKEKLTSANLRVDGSTYVPGTPLNRGEQFQAQLVWELDRAAMQETLTWKYQIPEQIHVDDVENAILFDEENNRMGTYSIKDGVLIVVYDKVQDINRTEFRLNATWDSSVTGDDTTIEWNDTLKTPVKFNDSAIAVTKKLTETDTLSNSISSGGTETGKSGSLIYTYQIDVKATKGTLTGVTMTDTLSAKDFSFVKGYFENNGQRYDYRYKMDDESYTYGNFVETNPGSGVWASCDAAGKEVIVGGMDSLKQDSVWSMEYAVMLPADRRFELDSQKSPTSLKNTAKAGGTYDGNKVESSVTVEQTYRPEDEWIIKKWKQLEESDVNRNNVAPFTLVINGGADYDMSGTVVRDEIGTPGMEYITPDNESYGGDYGKMTITIRTASGEELAEKLTPTWHVMEENYTQDEIKASRTRTGKEILEDFFEYYARYQSVKAGGEWGSDPATDYAANWARYRDYFYRAIGKEDWVGRNPDDSSINPQIKEQLSEYVFTTSKKTAFYWLVPDSNGTGQSYELIYYTDISKVDANVLANSASADWKHIVAGDEVGDFMQQVHLDKKNEGVREVEGTNGTEYYVDWTITVDVPSGSDAIPNVYLYDTLSRHTISTLSSESIYDWLVRLKDTKLDLKAGRDATLGGKDKTSLDHTHSSNLECYNPDGTLKCDQAEKLYNFSENAFNITVTSADSSVQQSVQTTINANKKATIGKPIPSGIKGHYREYDGDSPLGQLTTLDGKKITPTRFGIWLGELPATKDAKGDTAGYTITVTYTTQITPAVMEALEGTSRAYNSVELRSLLNGNEYSMAYAESSYKVTHTSVENGIDKYITDFDPVEGELSYEVRINPDASLKAIKSTYYTIADNLGLTGATYVKDSFELYFPGTSTPNQHHSQTADCVMKDGKCTTHSLSGLNWDRTETKDPLLIWSEKGGHKNNVFDRDVTLTVENKENASSSFSLQFRNSSSSKLALETPMEYNGKLLPLILKYKVKLPAANGNDEKHVITNGVQFWQKPDDSDAVLVDGADASFDFTSAMHKKLSQFPTDQNGYNAGFVINVDTTTEEWKEAMEKLNNPVTFTVKDTMSENLLLNLGSVKVTVIKGGEETVLDPSKYEFRTEKETENAPEDGTGDTETGEVKNVLYVTLPVSTECTYRIEYTAKVSGDINSDVSYSNAATVEGTSIKSEEVDRMVHISEQTGVSTGETFQIMLKKRDGNNLNAKLEATFKLSKIKLTCGAEEHTHTDKCGTINDGSGIGETCGKAEHTHTEECYKGAAWKQCDSETTTENGNVVVNGDRLLWNGKNDEGEGEFPNSMLEKGVWYKLEETSVPDGYRGSVTYFYTGGSAPVIPDGVTDPQYCPFRKDPVELYIPNYKVELNLLKVDKSEESKGKNLTGAEFALYDTPDCYNEGFTGGALATVSEPVDGKYTFNLNGSSFKPNTPYYLKETKAPDGYIISDQKYCVIFNTKGIVRLVLPETDAEGKIVIPVLDDKGILESGTGTVVKALHNSYVIPNEASYELPKTGGFGPIAYITAGALCLMLGAGFMYRKKCRGRRV